MAAKAPAPATVQQALLALEQAHIASVAATVQRTEAAKTAHKLGASVTAIAAALHTSRPAVYRLLAATSTADQ